VRKNIGTITIAGPRRYSMNWFKQPSQGGCNRTITPLQS
jgi:hypothetical protein